MADVTIPQLIEMTGFGRETLGKRMKEVKYYMRKTARVYDSREALPAIYNSTSTSSLSEAKTILAQKQAEKIELEMDIKRGGVLEYQPMLEMMQRTFVAFRTKMLSIPTKAAPKAVGEEDPVNVQILLEEYVWEALEEISDLVEFVKQFEPAPTGSGEESEAA